MEMKLNVYENKKVVKTFVAETYDLMFGTVEDIINLIDLDVFKGGISDKEFTTAVLVIIVKGFDLFKPLLKDIFDGLTDDDLRKVKIAEIVPVVINIVQYAFAQMGQNLQIGNGAKNG